MASSLEATDIDLQEGIAVAGKKNVPEEGVCMEARTRMKRGDLPAAVEEALRDLGGTGTVISVSKWVWNRYSQELAAAGDLFYTWQYDLRWAALKLRQNRKMKKASDSPRGVWQLRQR